MIRELKIKFHEKRLKEITMFHLQKEMEEVNEKVSQLCFYHPKGEEKEVKE